MHFDQISLYDMAIIETLPYNYGIFPRSIARGRNKRIWRLFTRVRGGRGGTAGTARHCLPPAWYLVLPDLPIYRSIYGWNFKIKFQLNTFNSTIDKFTPKLTRSVIS